jgi:uncharacterized protein
MPEHHILIYDYVPDILERRAPFREAHLAAITAAKADGRLVMVGPFGDPPKGGVFIFAAETPEIPEAFADADPYVINGLVAQRRIEPFLVV